MNHSKNTSERYYEVKASLVKSQLTSQMVLEHQLEIARVLHDLDEEAQHGREVRRIVDDPRPPEAPKVVEFIPGGL